MTICLLFLTFCRGKLYLMTPKIPLHPGDVKALQELYSPDDLPADAKKRLQKLFERIVGIPDEPLLQTKFNRFIQAKTNESTYEAYLDLLKHTTRAA